MLKEGEKLCNSGLLCIGIFMPQNRDYFGDCLRGPDRCPKVVYAALGQQKLPVKLKPTVLCKGDKCIECGLPDSVMRIPKHGVDLRDDLARAA
jgi:hypothetical protein